MRIEIWMGRGGTRGVRKGESMGGVDGDDEAFVHLPQGMKCFIVRVIGRAQCLGKGLADQ